MNIFKRLFKIGEAEAHSALDKLEDPIKMTEQGIRDMKSDLDKSLHALAEVKAMAIRSKNDLNMYTNQAADYEKKAMALLQRAEMGQLAPQEADRLASEALVKKTECEGQVERLTKEQAMFDKQIGQLDTSIKTIRANISKWENESKTLKARVKVAETTKNLNKALSQIDPNGTAAMLEKMKDKVAQEEALAESYGEIANASKSVDDEINKALDGPAEVKAADALAAMKAKMNANKSNF